MMEVTTGVECMGSWNTDYALPFFDGHWSEGRYSVLYQWNAFAVNCGEQRQPSIACVNR